MWLRDAIMESEPPGAAWYALLALLALPHAVYCFVWTQPRRWTALCGKARLQPVSALASFGAVVKLLQLALVGVYYLAVAPVIALSEIGIFRFLFCGALICFGQLLNVATYRALGKAGVYYGFKLGRKIPWVTSFPFNIGLSHPQYVGSVLTIWGIFALTTTPAHERRGWITTAAIWTLFYTATALIETYLH